MANLNPGRNGPSWQCSDHNIQNQGVVRAGSRTGGHQWLLPVVLGALPLLALVLSLSVGRYALSPGDVLGVLLPHDVPAGDVWRSQAQSVVLDVRLPRALLAMTVGMGLAVAGAAFQGLFRNPLVSPDILGVASGAGFGAALALLVSDNMMLVQASAFAFGLVAVSGAYLISRIREGTSLLMLVLAGVIISAVFQALVGLVKLLADPLVKLPTIVYWLMGSMATASYQDLLIGCPLILTASLLLLLLSWKINVLSLGEEAKAMGINVNGLRWLVIVLSTVITATAVSLCGVVGWIGLVVPHMGRMLVGPNHRVLLPVCLSLGATLLLIIDDLARSATAAEIPLSMLTVLIGAPFFAYLLRKTGGRWGS